MAQVRDQVEDLLVQGWEVYAVDEVRVEHETETRRMWLPAGKRTKICVDRSKAAQSFFGALSLTTKKMKIYPIEGNQNAEQVIFAMNRLVRETDSEKIAVVLDNAGFHHAKAVTELFKPGQQLERITPIFLSPYAPDHNPVEHVWDTAKNHIANTSNTTPRKRPTQHSSATSPAAPSTATSNTYQTSHQHTISFNSGHTANDVNLLWARTWLRIIT